MVRIDNCKAKSQSPEASLLFGSKVFDIAEKGKKIDGTFKSASHLQYFNQFANILLKKVNITEINKIKYCNIAFRKKKFCISIT